jgi:hypothetical protein
MQPLNIYRFYELGAKLHGLFCLTTQGRVADMFAPFTEAQALLDSFIKGDIFALEDSKTDATRLLNKLGAVFNRYFIDPTTKQLKSPTGEDRIDPNELSLINTLVEKFEHALAGELNRTPSYLAEKCGIYSTSDLAENAQRVFSQSLRNVIPSGALGEFNSAGRALAFGFGTAATMHMLRAIEITLKLYFETFVGAASGKGERNYTVYLKKLAALAEDDSKPQRPDRRVIQMLEQIKEHYRHPLLSPDTTISADEATQLFGLTSALITMMAEQMDNSRHAEKKSGKAALMPDDDDDDISDFPMSQAG